LAVRIPELFAIRDALSPWSLAQRLICLMVADSLDQRGGGGGQKVRRVRGADRIGGLYAQSRK
jgi:hypothetical protein